MKKRCEGENGERKRERERTRDDLKWISVEMGFLEEEEEEEDPDFTYPESAKCIYSDPFPGSAPGSVSFLRKRKC